MTTCRDIAEPREKHSTGKRWGRRDVAGAVAVVLLFCLPLFVHLGAADFENDEAIYTFAVRSILQTGDWLTPKSSPHLDIAFLEKPPLKFWIVAAPIRLGLLPDNEFGMRFWDALFGGIAFLYVFAIARRFGGLLAGVAAVLVLFVQEDLVFYHGLRTNNMEASVFLAYAGGVHHFLRWSEEEAPAVRSRHIWMMTFFFVLGFMTKFLAIAFLPLVLVLTALSTRAGRRRIASDLRVFAAAAAAALAVIAPWFVYQSLQFPGEPYRIMFGDHIMTRFTSYTDPAHVQPWHHYFTVLHEQLRDSGTLLLVLAGAVLLAAAHGEINVTERLVTFLWFFLPLSLLSFGSSKLYHYAYPFLPPVAIAAGHAVSVCWRVASRLAGAISLESGFGEGLRSYLRILEKPGLQWLLRIVAGLAGLVAAVTWFLGPLRIEIGGVLLLRNTSLVRPLLVAAVASFLAGRRSLNLVLVPVVALLLLPLPGYERALARLGSNDQALQTLGACLERVTNGTAGGPAARPGVLVALPERLRFHFFYQYLGGLGAWDLADSLPPDEILAASLDPNQAPRPVLIWDRWHVEFVRRGRSGLAESAASAIAADAVDRSPARSPGVSWDYQVLELRPEVLLLLPGRYAACDERISRAGVEQ